ncbi:unnamed protein product [Rhizoctonia solani]|uniref:Polysaccharide lyase family 8 protein n=1 Tax=Rhizoctonia solani TaxID=456999 RepID=A0A8H3D6B1_9AGAM|nr:unnamed protein product [Rhizoctonia solani]
MHMRTSAVYVTASLVALLSRAIVARADDIDTVYNRQVDYIIRTTSTSEQQIADYIANLQPNGSWSEIDYSAGCTARRSSWPAGGHWTRILNMAAAYKGKVPEYKDKPELLSALQLAMEFWFANDYSTIGDGSCMDQEFLPNNNCPCGTPGLWGPNWFSNVIQVPTRSGKACVLLRSELNGSQLANCTLIASRAYAPFYRNPQPGYLGGANVVDLAVIGISAGLLENNKTGNASRIAHAYEQVHNQVSIQPMDRVDGIKPDGSFQQHSGIIYNGNYGKDFSNSLIELELQALGTQFQASKDVQDVFGTHLDGSRWMTFTNVLRKAVHWDFSVIGRFISYPIADNRASASLQMSLDEVRELGNAWNQKDLIEFGSSLTGASDDTANTGKLMGNRMFWNSDYMIHRTERTVTTVKMLSSRTATGECTNSENPYGFHLSNGVVYTYTTGAEYEDIFAALDYNIPPGITTNYGATPLDCGTARRDGVDSYAGGVQAGDVGMAAMRYVDPFSQKFSFYKAWFFFPDNVQHVLVSNVQQSDPGSTSPVFSVLDQRLRSGDVYVNGSPSQSGNFTDAKSLWHAGTGYAFPTDPARSVQVSVSLESRMGDWSKLGTSRVPPSSKDLFAAWVPHMKLGGSGDSNSGQGQYSPIEYSVFPATSSSPEFEDKVARLRPRTVVNTETASAAIDAGARILGCAFWKAEGGTVIVKDMGIQVQVDRAVVIMLKFTNESRTKGTVSIADPTHGTGKVNVKITWPGLKRHGHKRLEGCIGHYCPPLRPTGRREAQVILDLPEGGMAGSTITSEFSRKG